MVLFALLVILIGITFQYRYDKNQYRDEKKSIPQMTILYRHGIYAQQYQLVLN